MKTTTTDREFTQSVGIRQDCDLCEDRSKLLDLLHIDIQRQKDATADRELRMVFLIQRMFNHRHEVNMWKLATFVGMVWGALMTYVSLR